MPASSRSPLWIGSDAAVVSLPSEIDAVNSAEVTDDLVAVIDAGARTVIADMSGAEFCDSSGVKAMVHAYRHAKAHGCALRLVVTSASVRRVFALTEMDRLVPICATLDEALSAPAP